jgi:SAM-dependent methyltransferase
VQPPPISLDEIRTRIAPHLDELLKLWWIEQGACKPRDLELMASVLPFPRTQPIQVLDLCCGPGDAGRAVWRAYPKAQIDGVDRETFLAAMCMGINQRDGVPGKIVIADLARDDWHAELGKTYDAVIVANALHWFHAERAHEVLRDLYGLMRAGGVLVFAEPVDTAPPFAAGFETWQATQPPRYKHEDWQRFWSKATEVLGYDPVKLWGPRPPDRVDDDMTVKGWTGLVQGAGFGDVEILWRDADQVIVAALK